MFFTKKKNFGTKQKKNASNIYIFLNDRETFNEKLDGGIATEIVQLKMDCE